MSQMHEFVIMIVSLDSSCLVNTALKRDLDCSVKHSMHLQMQ